MTIEQLQKDKEELTQQLQQAIQAEAQAVRQRAMIEGALQLLDIQLARLKDVAPGPEL